MAEDLAALVIRLSAEGSEKVQKDISAIGANTKVTTDILIGMNNTLKKIERSGLIGLRKEFTKTQTASAQLSDQIKTQQATITALQNKLKTLGSEQVTTTRATKDHTAEIEKHGKGIRNLIPHVAMVTLSYMAMRRAVRAVVETLTIGASFEHQMAIVGGIVRATTEEFEALSKAALKAGEETVWTATEAANALRYLGMAGLGTEDAIAALGGVLNLALIGEMNLSRATDIATDSLMAFGLKATELDKVVDVFVGTITRSNTNIEALGQAMKFAAPVASQLGYTIEQVSAMIGILSQSGIKAGIAGRALRMSLLRSADAAKELGISSSNLIDILKELNNRNLAPDELAATMHKLFGIEATPSMLIIMKNVAALEEFIDTLNNSAGETDAFIKRLDTVTVAWKEVASVIEDLAITAFLKYADSLKNGLKDLKEWIGDHKEDILGLFDDMVSVGKDIKEILIPALQATKVALSAIKEVTSTTDVGATTASVAGGVIGRYMFGSWTPAKILAVAYAVEILAGMLSKMSGIEIKGPFAKAKELIDDISKTGDDIKYAVKWWKDLFSTQTKGFDELAEEYDAVKPKVNALAVEVEELYEAVRIEAEEIGKAAIAHSEFQKTLDTHAIIAYKNAMAELSQLKWYELLPESDQKTDEIARLKAIADYEKQVVDELKSLWGSYYYQNEEKFKELTKHKVDAFTKLYDTQKSNTEKIKDIEDKYTQESGVLLSKFTNETYKQEILKQVNLYRESQISRLQATGEASDAAVKIAEETTKRSLEIFKEGLKNQKDSEKWFLDSKKELYKDDVAEQLKMLDEAYANYLNTHEDSLEAFEAYHAMRTKIYADAYKDEANALDTAMAEESKWMDGRIDAYVEFEKSKQQYRNDELQAMKSLYEELGIASSEYYELLREATELEYEKYIKQLGLKLAAGQEYTQKQLKMLEILNNWKSKKLANPYEDLYKSAQQLFDTTSFGDAQNQSVNNLMKSLEELSKMYDEIPKLLKKIEAAQQSLIDQDFSSITKTISDSLKDFNLDDFFKDGKLLENVSFDSFVDAFKKAYEEMGSIEQANHADTLKRILKEQQARNIAASNVQNTQLQMLSAQAGAWGQLFGTIKNMYAEGSKEYEEFAQIEKVARMAQILLTAVQAIVNAGASGDGYTAIARMAAMAAAVAAVLGQVGLSVGGPSGSMPEETKPASTVLGAEPGTASESIQNSYDMLEESHAREYAALVDIYNEVKQLNQNITGLVTALIKGVEGDFSQITTGNTEWIGRAAEFWNSMTEGMQKLLKLDPLLGWITGFVGGLIGKLVSSIFGGGGWTDVQRVGIIFGQIGQSFGAILEGGDLFAKLFADIHKHTEGGWFSSDTEEFWTEYKDLDKDTIRLLTKVFKSIGESFVTLAEGLGVDVQVVYDYIIPLTKLDLKGMNAEQISEAVTAYFSNMTDQMAEDLFGDILKQYQKVGEGLYETAVRIVTEKEIFLTALEMTGHAFNGTAQEAIALSQSVIELAGGIEALMEDVEAYYSAFFSESEQQAFTLKYLTKVMTDLGLTLPDSKAGFRALIESIDLTTEEGQKLYTALLAIAGAAAAYYDALEEQIKNITDAQRKLKGTETEGALQDIADRYGLQVSNMTQEWVQSIVDAFSSMSTDEVIALAKALGVSTEQLIADIMTLKKYFDSLTEWKKSFFDYNDSSIESIATRYGMDAAGMTESWWQSIMGNLKNMSETDFKALADSLGVSVEQLMTDLDALKQYFLDFAEETKRIREWQAGLMGKSDEYIISEFKKKYNIFYSINQDWVNELESWLASLSVEEFRELAAAYGVTVDELMADVDALRTAFDNLSARIKAIRDVLDSVGNKIAGWSGKSMNTSAGLAGQINAVLTKPLDKLSMDDLLMAANLMDQWADAAKAEADAAAQLARETATTWFEGEELTMKQLESKREELNLQEQITDKVRSLMDSIENTIKSIQYSSLNIALPTQKAEEAEEDLYTLFDLAKTGGSADIQKFLSFAPTALAQYQARYKSSGTYQDFYDALMGPGGMMEQIQDRAQSESFEVKLIEEIKGVSSTIDTAIKALQAEIELIQPDYSLIEEQFAAWAATTEGLIGQLTGLQLIINIDWENYEGTIADTLDKLMELVETYGWTNTITINWIANMAQWMSDATLADVKEVLNFIATNDPDGWTGKATITFISNLDQWLDNASLTDILDLMDYIATESGSWNSTATITFIAEAADAIKSYSDATAMLDYILEDGGGWTGQAAITFMANVDVAQFDSDMERLTLLKRAGDGSGWTSDATLAYVANLSDSGTMTWAQLETYLESLGLTETVVKTLRMEYDSTSAWSTWDLFKANVLDKISGLTATQVATIKAEYDATGSTWTSVAALNEALDDLGLPDSVTKTIKAEWASENLWSTWENAKTALDSLGLPATTVKTIQTAYSEAGDSLTKSAFEALLTGAGLTTGQVLQVMNELSGSVDVELSELEVWKVQTALLIGILQNTARTALALSGGMISALNVGDAIGWSLAAKLQEWFGSGDIGLWGAGGNSFEPFNVPDWGSGTSAFPTGVEVDTTTKALKVYIAGSAITLGGGVTKAEMEAMLNASMTTDMFGSPTIITETAAMSALKAWELAGKNNMVLTNTTYGLSKIKDYVDTLETKVALIPTTSGGLTAAQAISLTNAESYAKSSRDSTRELQADGTYWEVFDMAYWTYNKVVDAYNILNNATKGLFKIYDKVALLPTTSGGLTAAQATTLTNIDTHTSEGGYGADQWAQWSYNQAEGGYDILSNATKGLSAVYDKVVQKGFNVVTGKSDTEQISFLDNIYGDVRQVLTALGKTPLYSSGGIATGPSSGYLVTLHGTELVLPMNNGINIPVKWINGGSTQAGANGEEVELLREQNRLLAKLVTQSGQPLKIEGLGKYSRAQADEVIVQRTKQGRLNDGRRYNR